jgi:hypothetical protein
MQRMVSVFLCVAAATGVLAQQPPAPLPPEVGNAVLLATNSIQVDRNVVVTRGDLVVNDAVAGPLTLDQGVKTPAGFAVKANQVVIAAGAIVGGDVAYNALQNGGTIAGALITPLALPVIGTLPTLPPLQPAGTNDVAVAAGQVQPLGTGVYGTLSVGRDATLRLGGGPYVFASITTERGASIIFDGPGEIVVNGNITLGQSTTIGAAPALTTKHKMIFARGAITIGRSSSISATLFAPDGAIDADQSLTLTGALVARDIHVGHDSTLTLRSGFRNLPPHADDQNVAVGDTPVIITLTGSDPDDDPLHFTIGVPPTYGTLGPVVQAGPTSATVLYTPSADQPNDIFTFRVTDSEGFFANGVVTINAGIALPGPPTTITAQPGQVEIPPNAPAIIPLNAIGPPGVAITLSIVPDFGPLHGTFGPLHQPSVNPPQPGSIVYVPQQGYVGEDAFVFRACGTINNEQVCSDARIAIAVQGPESAGELAPDQTVSVTGSASLPILLTPGDPPNTVFRVLTLPANGTLTDSNGVVITSAPYTLPSAFVTFQAAFGFSGQNTFTYDATAGTQSDSGTVTINVASDNNGR